MTHKVSGPRKRRFIETTRNDSGGAEGSGSSIASRRVGARPGKPIIDIVKIEAVAHLHGVVSVQRHSYERGHPSDGPWSLPPTNAGLGRRIRGSNRGRALVPTSSWSVGKPLTWTNKWS